MAREVDIRTPRVRAPLGLLTAYEHVVLETASLAAAQAFYGGALGLSAEAAAEDETLTVRVGGQRLLLVQRSVPQTFSVGGYHVALRLPAPALHGALAGLARTGVPVHGYREDRAVEQAQNRYCADPDGNRLQLVEGPDLGLDHVAIETHDLEWAETFYTHVLGGCVQSRFGWRMDDFTRALAWGEGQEQDDCAPGTRRWDRRYTTMEGQARVARPNSHLFVDFGGPVLGIYLATEHRQEPPPDQLVGTPRVGFRVAPGQVDAVADRLVTLRLRCMRANRETGGPFTRDGQSLFVRDPSGNFLELVAR